MPKKWNIENLDTCYRHNIKSYGDGFEHAISQNIPDFIEEYRLSRVKDAIAPWITGEKTSGESHQITKSPELETNSDLGPKVLDIGCGHGWYCFRLIDKWNFNGHITGVDVSEHNISIFNDEIKKRNFEGRLSAKFANAENLPFDDNSFDLVYSTEALEHMESPEKVFSETARVLKSGGMFILTTPSGPMHCFWKMFFLIPTRIKRLFVKSKTLDIQKIFDNPLSWNKIKKYSKGKRLELIHYNKAVLLPHESYIQFFPGFMQKFILMKAKFMELLGPFTSWSGLHHIAIWKKK